MSGNDNDQKKGFFDKPLSRRDILKLAGVGGAGLLLGAGGVGGIVAAQASKTEKAFSASGAETDPQGTVPFYGGHQAGIVTPVQDFICFAAFDVTASSLAEVRKLFQAWTAAAANMAQGKMVGQDDGNELLPPSDTGEAAGLTSSRTTITFGAGPSFFDGRFGLAGKKPEAIQDLPAFGGDELRPEWCGGDLCVQVCANDMQIAFHAIRNLARIARGKAVLRWTQEGFQRTGYSDPAKATPRNLMGFKDGTGNPDVKDEQEMKKVVWADSADGSGWMHGGSYMVVRRIRMRIEVWDRSTLADQEATFGRHRNSGAPLGASGEFDSPDMEKKDASGKPVIPATSHFKLARGDGSVKILRRSYSYSTGIDHKTGQLDAGLLFVCYQRDPRKQFVPIQKALGKSDKLNEYIVHIGSAVFACFPGVKEGGYIGDTLF
ncbi:MULTISPECIES: iron uptake transporter deferrochelatase/peroxidase subunit [unclassified Paenibacillus]|uniref:iron uptake transporter deferrochelatase/peroxidase subunit n=1 Tax=unclassified Paenibacillus TaxID=185978 RepID=UPI00020D65EE|nr:MULTISPECIES: iron uptake transporter deferrochelatase/peroxidase subunit [unclassified Paenibacillus]EGL20285.1 Tat-translocated enzyme [Paenibacillus sp. HGF7]EPD88976.1 tat-translocated enzyme [Paenibacillus sp. HGH0039]